MTEKTTKIKVPERGTRNLAIRSQSYDAEAGTVEIVYATTSDAERFGYTERLIVSEEAIDTTRLDAGAVNLISDHDIFDFSGVVGRVIEARVEGDQAVAVVQLSRDATHAGIVENIKAGVIRTVSVGYQILDYEVTDNGGSEVLTVKRWMPCEISLVVVPADPNAQIRSADRTKIHRRDSGEMAPQETTPEEQQQKEGTMDPEELENGATAGTETQVTDTTAEVTDTGAAAGAAGAADDVAAERSRAAQIMNLCNRHAMPANFATRQIEAGASLDQVRAAILDRMSDSSTQVRSRARVGEEPRDTLVSRALDAVSSRMTGREPETDGGRALRNLSMVEMARQFVGSDASMMTRSQVIDAALSTRATTGATHVSSDFAHVLGSAAHRTLRAAYEAQERTFTPFVREVENTDFRPVERVSIGDAPVLEKKKEGGEIKYGTFGDGAEIYALETYAKALSMSRQMLVNDDLNAFARMLNSFAARGASLEADLVYAILTGSYKMSDGKAVFVAGHNNLITDVLSVDGLSAARKAMRKQTGVGGTRLNLSPKTLIVGPDLETDAFRLTAAISAAASGDVNPFAGKLTVAVDDRIEDASWFLAADPNMVDTIELAYLAGAKGVQSKTIDNPMRDGVDVIAQLDVAAAPIDFRGMVKSTGTGA